ncbi:MAG: hypothetical protein NW220_00935 [Leptolyngbyaceae cyanobacterium bins.349]|nr:hypothetical protein [Leptolyngbyaceae cyanobacterium bins.349]
MMFRKTTLLAAIAGLGILLGVFHNLLPSATWSASAAPTSMSPLHEQTAPSPDQFQQIQQPLSHRIIVTLGGLGLIGLELWWFLLSKPKSRQVTAGNGANNS